MSRVPPRVLPVPLDASECAAAASQFATPCPASPFTSDSRVDQRDSSFAALAGVASSLGSSGAGAEDSVSAATLIGSSSPADNHSDTLRAPTIMTPLSFSKATLSISSPSPMTSPAASATPSTSVSARPLPQDRSRSGNGSSGGENVLINAQDMDRQDRAPKGQGKSGLSQKDQNRQDQGRRGQDSPGKGDPSQDNRGSNNRGSNDRGENDRGENRQNQNNQGQNNQGQNNQSPNESRGNGRNNNRDGERASRQPEIQPQVSTQGSVSKSSSPQSRTATSSTASSSSVQPLAASSSSVQSATASNNNVQSSASTSVATPTSTTTEKISPTPASQESALAPKTTQVVETASASSPPPPSAQLASSTEVSQPTGLRDGGAPTEEALNPVIEATKSQVPEQPPAPTSAQPAPPESSPPTASGSPRPEPETSIARQEPIPAPQPSTNSQNALPTGDPASTAIPIEPPASSISPSPSVVLGEPSPNNSPDANPPPNFIPLGGSPKGLGDAGGAPKTNSASEKSMQAPRGLPLGGIVGISVGGFAAILLLGLALWLWRKSKAKKRQDGPPEPFADGTPNNARDGEASEKIESAQGPRIGAEKLASSLGVFKEGSRWRAAVGKNWTGGINGGDAQLWNRPPASRDNVAMALPMRNGLTDRDRETDWWTQRGGDFGRADRARNSRGGAGRNRSVGGAVPDFPPQAGFRTLDPFADTNASPYKAVNTAQASQFSPFNPFADPDARVLPADRLPAAPPRAHGRSQSVSVRESNYPPRSTDFRPNSALRESLQSKTPFADRRNKGRSDPFDLEIESRLIPSADDVAQMPRLARMSSNYSSHTRGSSLPYSQYSSGVSLSDWSVMGMAAGIGLTTGPPVGGPGQQGDLARRPSDKSRPQGGGGVGQAL